MSIVIASRSDRLGGRLRNLLSGWDFAKKIDAQFAVNWPGTGHAKFIEPDSYDFFDLFDEISFRSRGDISLCSTLPHEIFLKKRLRSGAILISDAPWESIDYFKGAEKTIIYNATDRYRFSGEEDGINSISHERELFQSLTLNDKVSDCLGESQKKFPFSEAISLHIRRGDVVPILQNAGHASGDWRFNRVAKWTIAFADRYAPVQAYHAAIADHPAPKYLCIFSDDKPLRDVIADQYTDFFVDTEQTKKTANLSAVQAAFSDILMMSSTSSIICTNSSFSLFAAFIGRAEATPVMRYADPEQLIHDIDEILHDAPQKSLVIDSLISAYDKLLPNSFQYKQKLLILLLALKHPDSMEILRQISCNAGGMQVELEAAKALVSALREKRASATNKVKILRETLDVERERTAKALASLEVERMKSNQILGELEREQGRRLTKRIERVWRRVSPK